MGGGEHVNGQSKVNNGACVISSQCLPQGAGLMTDHGGGGQQCWSIAWSMGMRIEHLGPEGSTFR